MDFVTVKPLSVNECWKGRRMKTDKYNKYEHDLLFLLPRINLPVAPYRLELLFGVSNMASDFDNPVKPFVDILQKKYLFNDKQIMEALIKKTIVQKGREYIGFKITTYEAAH